MNHDELFKELLHHFFREFFTLFFPQEAALLDLSEYTIRPTESFTDFPEGMVRRADVVVEVTTRVGEREVILIHTEIQAKRDADIGFRMWEYYHLLRFRYRLPVFPIVLYLAPGAGGLVTERYNEAVLGRSLVQFEYAVVGLPDLQAEDYEAMREPFSSSIASLMRSRARNKAKRKYQKLLRIAEAQMDEARQTLLAVVVENYLPLDAAASAEFEQLLEQEAAKRVATIINPYELRGIEKGLRQGLQQQQSMLQHLLQAKFGTLPDGVVAEVSALSQPEQIEAFLLRILTASTLGEMGFQSVQAS